MKRYLLEATLMAPLVVRRDRQSERSEGVTSVSGTLVRGALAQAYLQRSGRPDDAFHRLFLDEASCRFGPLDPATCSLPLTALSCKRHPGFHPKGHGVVDQLWARIGLALAGPGDHMTNWRRCRICPNDLKNFGGFWEPREGGGATPQALRHLVDVHVGIDRACHTAAEAIFYALEAIDPVTDESDEKSRRHNVPTVLRGWILADDDGHRILCDLLTRTRGEVTFGHARTRGYGRVLLKLTKSPAVVTETWDVWSAELIQFLAGKPFGVAELDAGRDFLFGLSFPAGAVLVDELLRYTLDPADMVSWLAPLPAPDDIRRVAERVGRSVDGGELRCVAAVTKHERVRGWNAAHGLPRQDEWAVSRGSVYAYWFRGDASQRAALKARLKRLQDDGVGARRNEGFGDVRVSDDFHRRFHEQESRR